jgi:cobalamin biosynthesis Mg chelatase CobN
VWVTAQALNGLEGKPFPLPPAPRKKARSVAVAATAASAPHTSTTTTTTTAPRAAKRHVKPAHMAAVHTTAAATAPSTQPAAAPQPAANDTHVQVKPVAQTTTTSDPPPASNDDGPDSYWPYIFAVLLGVAILAGLRLAWRRE